MLKAPIGKYEVTQEMRLNKESNSTTQVPILLTDNAREAVWTANKDPQHTKIRNIRGEKDFYLDEGKWHSFDL